MSFGCCSGVWDWSWHGTQGTTRIFTYPSIDGEGNLTPATVPSDDEQKLYEYLESKGSAPVQWRMGWKLAFYVWKLGGDISSSREASRNPSEGRTNLSNSRQQGEGTRCWNLYSESLESQALKPKPGYIEPLTNAYISPEVDFHGWFISG